MKSATADGSAPRGPAACLGESRRLVVKIGSALLVNPADGRLNRAWLETIAADVARLRKRGCEIMIVSSGAIALGRRYLGIEGGKLRLDESQAAAAAGQIRLAHAYQEALDAHDTHVAQVLVTLDDTERRDRYLNARNTLNTLLSMTVVPVANENDTVATTEIRYGDNDRLAARIAQMIGADCLMLLSDIDGLYSADPNTTPDAQFIPVVERITPELEAAAGEAASPHGSGGMVTKLAAARIAISAGCDVLLASGRRPHPVQAVADGARCTWFKAAVSPRTARQQWIAGSLQPRGRVTVDAGAAAALRANKSLLPAGVVAIEGEFGPGDTVAVRTAGGELLAHGLCAYSATDARRIMGHRSSAIEEILRYRGRDELIHRDDLVLTE